MNNTEREQLENLMAIAEQVRESQKAYFKGRNSVSRQHVATLLNDAKIKEDALDNLLKYLRTQGYSPQKIVSKAPEQGAMF